MLVSNFVYVFATLIYVDNEKSEIQVARGRKWTWSSVHSGLNAYLAWVKFFFFLFYQSNNIWRNFVIGIKITLLFATRQVFNKFRFRNHTLYIDEVHINISKCIRVFFGKSWQFQIVIFYVWSRTSEDISKSDNESYFSEEISISNYSPPESSTSKYA